jgi:Invasion associated locus B (IalB) protein
MTRDMPGARLFAAVHARICPAMSARPLLLACLFLLPTLGPAAAETAKPAGKAVAAKPSAAKPAGPKAIGKFDDWTAATNKEAGQTVCYAFTRAQTSAPALPGRGDVVLTVTERQGGRDAVAISAGFAFAANAAVSVAVDPATLDFYTSQRSAFARDGHAATQAFLKGKQAVAHSPGPKAAVVDTFSLKGFAAAYAAIAKTCPAGKPAS